MDSFVKKPQQAILKDEHGHLIYIDDGLRITYTDPVKDPKYEKRIVAAHR